MSIPHPSRTASSLSSIKSSFHLMEHELPVWPIDVNSENLLETSNSNSIRYIKSALIHIATITRPELVADDSPQTFITDVSIHAPIPTLPVRLHGAIPKHITHRFVPVILLSQRGGQYSIPSPIM